jgi:DNA repair exonuclease SbcCD ATPase subunit
MQIVKVTAKGFMGIEYVEVVPKKTVTVIGGRNRQGKTSLLTAIASAIGGKKLCPEKPIRTGEDAAKVSVDLDGDPTKLIPPITVTREFFRKDNGDIDSKLEITTKDGYAAPSPQTLLNDVCGKLGFDPEAFLRMDAKKQADVLRELVGLDFSKLDAEYKRIYDERTSLTREGKSLKGQLDGCKKHDDAPAEEVSITELAGKLKEIHAVNQKNEAERQKLRECEQQIKRVEAQIVESEQRVKELERHLEAARQVLGNFQRMGCDELNKAKEQAAIVNALKDKDTAEVEAQIASAEQTNRKVRENAKHAEIAAAVAAKQAEWKAASERLKAIEAEKQAMRKAAKWPVEGLGYDETGVTYNGVPFAQASSYEQRKIAMGICVALSPALRFAFLRDGSLLDEAGLLEFAELAATNSVQLFVERVGKGAECNIVIEGGEVESVDGVPVAKQE